MDELLGVEARLFQDLSGVTNRAAILNAARQEFGRVGYCGATVRSIAQAAGVDSRLIYHYFGTKMELFRSAVSMSEDLHTIRDRILAGDRGVVGMNLAYEFFQLWSLMPGEVRALVAGAMSHTEAADVLRERLVSDLLDPLLTGLGVGQRDLRAALVSSHLLGLALLYDLVPVPVLAGNPVTRLAAMVAPELQRLLTGEV